MTFTPYKGSNIAENGMNFCDPTRNVFGRGEKCCYGLLWVTDTSHLLSVFFFWFGPRGAGIRRLTSRQKIQGNQYQKERLIRHTGQSGHGSVFFFDSFSLTCSLVLLQACKGLLQCRPASDPCRVELSKRKYIFTPIEVRSILPLQILVTCNLQRRGVLTHRGGDSNSN